MSHNTFGQMLRMTTWGESHGPALGCVVDEPNNPANGQMWGGLGLAVIDPQPRQGPLTIQASGRPLFERCAAARANPQAVAA